MSGNLELYLFTPDPEFAARAVAGGVDGIVIDWERVGKETRQQAADTEINLDTDEDLRRVRSATSARILCRINPIGDRTEGEIEAAVRNGADEVLVPMVRTRDEVERALECARSRIAVGILIETIEAVERARELGRAPLSRVYVGLNDLAIERRSPSIFSAILDGTVERVRDAVRVPFGVAGMTVPDGGEPIPSRLLVGELVRLGCAFTFLRRSFRRDVAGRRLGSEVSAMRGAVADAARRPELTVARDRDELELRILTLEASTTADPVLRANA